MSIHEILAELPTLSPEDRAEIQLKLDELAGVGEGEWIDDNEFSDDDKRKIDEGLAAYLRNPNDVTTWEEAEARIRAKLAGQ